VQQKQRIFNTDWLFQHNNKKSRQFYQLSASAISFSLFADQITIDGCRFNLRIYKHAHIKLLQNKWTNIGVFSATSNINILSASVYLTSFSKLAIRSDPKSRGVQISEIRFRFGYRISELNSNHPKIWHPCRRFSDRNCVLKPLVNAETGFHLAIIQIYLLSTLMHPYTCVIYVKFSAVCLLLAFHWQCIRVVFYVFTIHAIEMYIYLLTYQTKPAIHQVWMNINIMHQHCINIAQTWCVTSERTFTIKASSVG